MDNDEENNVLRLVEGPVDEALVNSLKTMLEAAQEGRLTAIFGIVQYKGGEFEPVLVGNCDNVATTIGMLHILAADMTERARNESEE